MSKRWRKWWIGPETDSSLRTEVHVIEAEALDEAKLIGLALRKELKAAQAEIARLKDGISNLNTVYDQLQEQRDQLREENAALIRTLDGYVKEDGSGLVQRLQTENAALKEKLAWAVEGFRSLSIGLLPDGDSCPVNVALFAEDIIRRIEGGEDGK